MPTAVRPAIVVHAVVSMLSSTLAAQVVEPPQQDVATLIKKLEDKSESISNGAVRDLMLIGEKAVPALIDAFPQGSRRLKFKIVFAFSNLGAKAEAAVPLLIKLMSDEDIDLKLLAMTALYQMGPAAKAAIPVMKSLWNDSDPRVRSDSRVVALQIGLEPESVVPAVLDALDDPAPILREKMVQFLATRLTDKLDESQTRRALDSMTEMLNIDENVNVRQWAVRSIVRFGPPALDRLCKLVVDEGRPKLRKGAISALGLYRPVSKKQVDTLLPMVHDKEYRDLAFEALGRLGETSVPGLLALLQPGKQPMELIRKSLQLLGSMGESGVACVPRVRELMASDDEELRFHATTCLRLLGPNAHAAVADLQKGLADESERIRLECVEAFGNLGDAALPALPKLIAIIREGSIAEGHAASGTLRNLGKHALPGLDELIACFGHKRERVRMWASYACGGMGSEACQKIGQVLSANIFAKEDSLTARITAARALGEIGELGKGAAEALRVGLGADEARLRIASAQAIGRIGEGAAELVPDLIKAMKDPEELVRLSATSATGLVGVKSKELTKALLSALEDKSQSVRWAAIEAIGGVRDDYAIPTLVGLLGSDEMHDRWRAAEALGKLGKMAEIALPDLQRLTHDSYVVATAAKEAIKKIRE